MNEKTPIYVKNSGYIELQRIVDANDGSISIINGSHDLPFEIQRVYYINHLENCQSIRGKHAHKKLNQVIFCINGSFVLSLDDGKQKQDILMWRDNLGVILGPELWHTMHSFSSGCILLVVASDYYDENDYIRNYDEFLHYVRKTNDQI